LHRFWASQGGAGASFAVAKVIAAIFLVLFIVLVALAWGIGSALN
jgi:hypothetical protein